MNFRAENRMITKQDDNKIHYSRVIETLPKPQLIVGCSSNEAFWGSSTVRWTSARASLSIGNGRQSRISSFDALPLEKRYSSFQKIHFARFRVVLVILTEKQILIFENRCFMNSYIISSIKIIRFSEISLNLCIKYT